ncbi:MAG: glutamate 5-kinase [Eubacterium sp.]|nr:glutamate 5-kinase [Eubacterium sp.]MBR2559584.1 glutamate 5-kinase [Bacillota bacterium]MBR3212174.1 glutamate 5-kinase [Bacillota bacterium]
MNGDIRAMMRSKKRVVVKIGSSSLTHMETGRLDLVKLEILVRELSDLRNRGIDVVLVTSGAIMAGRTALGFSERPQDISEKQACAAVGQARLMMIYQKLFAEYNQVCGQILLTKNNVTEPESRENAKNTFDELLKLKVIPVVNENDTVATQEIESLAVFGDNDTLSAVVAELVGADLLILLSDIDGLYTADPHTDSSARFISIVESLDESVLSMGKSTTGTNAGTGGMATKLSAARIAMDAGIDMVIGSGEDFRVLHRILDGEDVGTLFAGSRAKRI